MIAVLQWKLSWDGGPDTMQMALLYGALLLHVLAFAVLLADALLRRALITWIGWLLFATAFLAATGSTVYRGVHAGHFPLQTMFEVFLVMGMLMFPLSVVCRKGLRVGGAALDALLAVLLLFPAAFVERFSPEPKLLPPALQSPLFIPHVATYMIAYVALAKAAVASVTVLILGADRASDAPRGLVDHETAMDRLVRLGFPLLTAGLVLGAVWAQRVYGDFWSWDPKEMLSLATWLAFALYFHARYTLGRRRPRILAGIVVAGLVLMLATLLLSQVRDLLSWLFDITFESYHTYSG
jgi:ABC-type transport system involved in cytochrome c biogenesis permease subunit